jgi:hypothetical protein
MTPISEEDNSRRDAYDPQILPIPLDGPLPIIPPSYCE